MDDLGNLLVEKGISYVLNLVLGCIVIYFIKKEREDRQAEFAGYKLEILNLQTTLKAAGTETYDALLKTIAGIKVEFNLFKLQIDMFSKNMDEFKTEVTRQSLGLKVHSTEIHNRSEVIKRSIDDVIGRVTVIEGTTRTQQEILKKIVERVNKVKT